MSEGIFLRGMEVVDIMVDGVDHDDAPDYVDAFFCDATWAHNGYPLDEDALYELQEEYPDLLHEMASDS